MTLTYHPHIQCSSSSYSTSATRYLSCGRYTGDRMTSGCARCEGCRGTEDDLSRSDHWRVYMLMIRHILDSDLEPVLEASRAQSLTFSLKRRPRTCFCLFYTLCVRVLPLKRWLFRCGKTELFLCQRASERLSAHLLEREQGSRNNHSYFAPCRQVAPRWRCGGGYAEGKIAEIVEEDKAEVTT
ncbi:hypothetical protein C8Q74DRAFT_370494 [Fomes fomentarius]|nr:hypothetical protein C8Q74DRAFT_370494 [Fomes fomentarius]